MGMDPVAPNPENIHSFNRYAYANNNPYKFVDPDGRNPELLFSSCPTCFSTGFDNPETAYSSRANALGVNLNTVEGKRELAKSMFAEAATLSAVIPVEGAIAAGLSRFAVAKGLVDPRTIRFTQDSIKSTFKDGRSLRGLIDDLKSGKITSDGLPAIRTFERDGKLYSLDNRRLKAFQEAGVPIRTRPATADEIANETFKFTSKNGGASIRVRGDGL